MICVCDGEDLPAVHEAALIDVVGADRPSRAVAAGRGRGLVRFIPLPEGCWRWRWRYRVIGAVQLGTLRRSWLGFMTDVPASDQENQHGRVCRRIDSPSPSLITISNPIDAFSWAVRADWRCLHSGEADAE